MIEFTEWAVEILTRTHEAARRLNADATVRLSRADGGVAFGLTDEPEEGDERVERPGFMLLVEPGIEGLVDVEEPHDRLVLRPLGSDPNPRGER